MIDKREQFITQKVEKYLAMLLKKEGKSIYFGTKDCTKKHRKVVYERTMDMLKLIGIAFETEKAIRNVYKIKVLSKEEILRREFPPVTATQAMMAQWRLGLNYQRKELLATMSLGSSVARSSGKACMRAALDDYLKL